MPKPSKYRSNNLLFLLIVVVCLAFIADKGSQVKNDLKSHRWKIKKMVFKGKETDKQAINLCDSFGLAFNTDTVLMNNCDSIVPMTWLLKNDSSICFIKRNNDTINATIKKLNRGKLDLEFEVMILDTPIPQKQKILWKLENMP